MEYRHLGTRGLEVSRIGLGTIPFGTLLDDAACDRVVSAFAEAGGNLVDTANLYGGGRRGANLGHAGEAERAVGRALKGRRHRFVVATKGYWLMEDDVTPGSVGLGRAYLTREIDASLDRLGTDHIDLYQCHAWDFDTPLEETLETLDNAVQAGKIRHFGVSNWDSWQVILAAWQADRRSLVAPISNQVWYNLLDRTIEHSVVPACRAMGMGLIAWGIGANGLLSGRYTSRDRPPASGRFSLMRDAESVSWRRLATERSWAVIGAVRQVAAQQSLSMMRVAAAWALQRGDVDVALIGGSSAQQYLDQLTDLDRRLPADAMDALSGASRPDAPYPVDLQQVFCRRDSPDYGGLR
jgi:aryl-alcohol dehydrogenase-like predicted oxidoreductase